MNELEEYIANRFKPQNENINYDEGFCLSGRNS